MIKRIAPWILLAAALYESLPRKAVQLQRSYTALPRSYSLKQYAPYPGDQGAYGTCGGWSSAYAARTISESLSLNRLDRFLTTANVFSPVFVYKSVFARFYNNPNPDGNKGIAISWALDIMKEHGAVKMLDIETTAPLPQLPLSLFSNSRRYPISGYTTLYTSSFGNTGGAERTQMVKKSIAEGKPVIIGMNTPDSFHRAKGVWNPTESPYTAHGGHALCVVGYDDTRYGGAFEVQNSWGMDWGNNGYRWIPYAVFDRFAAQAYEIIESLPAYKDAAEYAGFALVEVYGSSAGMPVSFQDGYYKTTNPYVSGTRFRYLLGNEKPAYVYAFAGDSGSAETTPIFPPAQTSPVLDYRENIVAFPGENLWIELDQRTGTDYLVVLYAKEELDIDAIRRRFSQARGSFPERVAAAVGANYMAPRQAAYEPAAMRFTARSARATAVFGLLLAIDHR